ncbi:MAG: hypothetical protein CMQ05_01745 [Gammaproteobacteria bacterium]|nr:hypothetical protein [Gammaproteobacteria bacterium]RPG26607.1 MAG: hypothetical protein CBC10_003535 [Gammaproteobacteria bacterium TMED50]|tara:strand:+ start:224 stop:1108 length:885 start_codon:yes stop_codon:yes gene_type:complete
MATAEARTQSTLPGYFPPDYDAPEVTYIDVEKPVDPINKGPTPLLDARLAQTGRNTTDFFREKGFVLLPHHSEVMDWNGDYTSFDNDITRIYSREVAQLVHELLLPDEKVEMQFPHMVLRRGPNTENPFYGQVIHQDFGLSAEHYRQTTSAYASDEAAIDFIHRYRQDDVIGMMVLNFWRPLEMQHPIEHMPLAVCDASSIPHKDIVISSLLGFSHTGKPTRQLSLKYNPDHRWYYYPEMTNDEVLAMIGFSCFKDDPEHFNSAYHTAFEDPLTPEGAEERRNTEFRITVFLLR